MTELATRLGRLVALLSTDQDGEALAAVRAIDRTLKAARLTWYTLADVVAFQQTHSGRIGWYQTWPNVSLTHTLAR